ncbi:MAG: D-alanine--D-alanine ligase family protein [Bryobacteraceae bacterium]|jgi:D-alanine-D-alanine ligase
MKLRVAVLYGGRSGEHEVSLRSARAVIEALDRDKYEVAEYEISKEGRWSPRAIMPEPGGNAGIDVVIPMLHGTFGEDGTLQGLLEMAGLAYVGAGVLGSAVSMDKDVTKRLCLQRGLPVVEYAVVWRDQIEGALPACDALPFPVFVKPANLGSSVGISKAHDKSDLRESLRLAAQFDAKIIVERGIDGREFECAVLGNQHPEAAMPCEILPSREFYDYEDKYLLDEAETVLPADLDAPRTAELRRLAVECYRTLGCEGMARVDFLLEQDTGKLFINEINTVPGFTSISMYPKMWAHCGLPMPKLLDRLIELALERQRTREGLRYSR